MHADYFHIRSLRQHNYIRRLKPVASNPNCCCVAFDNRTINGAESDPAQDLYTESL